MTAPLSARPGDGDIREQIAAKVLGLKRLYDFAALVEECCEVMHDAYEAAAVETGWETQERSRKPWADVPEANKVTMRRAVSALLAHMNTLPTVDGATVDEAAVLRAAADELDNDWVQNGRHQGLPGAYSGGYARWLRKRADALATVPTSPSVQPASDDDNGLRAETLGSSIQRAATSVDHPLNEYVIAAIVESLLGEGWLPSTSPVGGQDV